MKPMALAALEPNGPALMVFTRMPHFLPASNANTLVSDSKAALAEDIPPPYPGMILSLAKYVKEMHAPPLFINGPNFCNIAMFEYELAEIAPK